MPFNPKVQPASSLGESFAESRLESDVGGSSSGRLGSDGGSSSTARRSRRQRKYKGVVLPDSPARRAWSTLLVVVLAYVLCEARGTYLLLVYCAATACGYGAPAAAAMPPPRSRRSGGVPPSRIAGVVPQRHRRSIDATISIFANDLWRRSGDAQRGPHGGDATTPTPVESFTLARRHHHPRD